MTVLALKSEYACKMSGPVLRSVDTDIFRLRYFMDCMSCGFCNDICCSYGVDIDLENVARLKAMPQQFKDYIGVPDSEWFTTEVAQDPEFPSGAYVRTQVRNGRCVFLNRQARGCKVHTYCLNEGIDYHLLKPMVSILFPVTFDEGLLHASNEVVDKSLICEGKGPTCYEGARGELLYYFGPELVAELDALAREETSPVTHDFVRLTKGAART